MLGAFEDSGQGIGIRASENHERIFAVSRADSTEQYPGTASACECEHGCRLSGWVTRGVESTPKGQAVLGGTTKVPLHEHGYSSVG